MAFFVYYALTPYVPSAPPCLSLAGCMTNCRLGSVSRARAVRMRVARHEMRRQLPIRTPRLPPRRRHRVSITSRSTDEPASQRNQVSQRPSATPAFCAMRRDHPGRLLGHDRYTSHKQDQLTACGIASRGLRHAVPRHATVRSLIGLEFSQRYGGAMAVDLEVSIPG
jgi:hypothetical protein